jgi:hypothetical protein
MYVKLKDWNPPPASIEIKHRIAEFEKQLVYAIKNHNLQHKTISNLTKI